MVLHLWQPEYLLRQVIKCWFRLKLEMEAALLMKSMPRLELL
ncbi:hypothetical protein ES703_124606 [subsurface metagenome]